MALLKLERLRLAVVVSSMVVGSFGCGGSKGAAPGAGSSGGGGTGSGAAVSTSSGAATGGAASASGSSQGRASGATGGDGSSCLGESLLKALNPSGTLLIGVSSTDALVATAPFDLRYEYIAGGLFDGPTPCASCANNCTSSGHACSNASGGCAWWGCYQYDQDPPGEYIRDFDTAAAAGTPPQIPMFTYYQLLQAADAAITGFQEGTSEATEAATNAALMERYYNDWRFLLQQIGQNVAIVHIEPDFWGYAQMAGPDPTALKASVSANPDCSTLPDTIAGMGHCMVAMVRKYAPHALVGLHASAWAAGIDLGLNTDSTVDVAGISQKVAAFLSAAGEDDADLIIVETSDRDAGYYQSIGRNTAWDATNATLPNFHQDFAWVTALTEALGKPALYWQTPLGNASQNNTTNHWKDNRVDYFFAHMNELAAAHVIGAAFGAGAGDQTLPTTDGGNLVAKTKAYVAAGGQALCP